MPYVKTFDKLLLVIFFVFSCWFMWKSFGYDVQTHDFVFARNVVGDFGLHVSLIRSVSLGNNIPVQSPFFPGALMPYHYAVDLAAGLLERAGVRIDIALNGVSAIAFTALLYVIYLLPQRIFGKNIFLGMLSVLLVVFPSSLSFIDFFRGRSLSFSLLKDIWRIPDYIHAGPFDGSLISIFFTLNAFSNQRHLVVGLAIALWIIYWLFPYLTGKKEMSTGGKVWLGVSLGVLGWVHTLLFLGASLVIGLLCLSQKKMKLLLIFFAIAAVIAAPRAWIILRAGLTPHPIWNPGFLSGRPFGFMPFISYWWLNLGAALVLLPVGLLACDKKKRILFWPAALLFVVANTFQLSYRIDHNHSILNLFIIIADFYVAYALYALWRKGLAAKVIVGMCLFLLTISGFLGLMAVKNDYQLYVADAPKNSLMQWIRTETAPDSVFLSAPRILDPVTLSGRYNYLGHSYYLSVMGYDTDDRADKVKRFFEADSPTLIGQMHAAGIGYVIIPNVQAEDFPYNIDRDFWNTMPFVYRDREVTVFKL